jgi:hypothetical protein
MKLQDHDILKPAKGLCTVSTPDGRLAAWNRHRVHPLVLSPDCRAFFRILESGPVRYGDLKGRKRLVRLLLKHHLLQAGDGDEGARGFQESLRKAKGQLEIRMARLRTEGVEYSDLTINTEVCNLACPYCVLNHTTRGQAAPEGIPPDRQVANTLSVLRQFAARRPSGQKGRRTIHFNGGEILTRWHLVQAAVAFIEGLDTGERFDLSINTNATLVTDEVAAFLAAHFRSISISLDGDRKHHDLSRVGHDGSPSFDRVARGLAALDRHLEAPIDTFQGTLTSRSSFDPASFQSLADLGLARARLSVDLLHTGPLEAVELARKHLELTLGTRGARVQVSDTPFQGFHRALAGKAQGFAFACAGLSPSSTAFLHYNVDRHAASTTCGFLKQIAVGLDEVGGDLHHPAIAERGLAFLMGRLRAFEGFCLHCELATLCRGGCIMNGLDAFNALNPSACAFAKATWRGLLERMSADAPLHPSRGGV